MSWKEMIPDCFGIRELSYAKVNRDKERAIKMVAAVNNEKVTKSEFEATMREFMLKRGTELHIHNLLDHIEEQMKWILKKKFIKGTSQILSRD